MLVTFLVLSVSVAYFSARKEEERGANFWRTFLMSFIGSMAILLMFYKMMKI